ncbi:MAG TPA: DNA alkylation repair protein [Bacteroidales bacterium]|nr:DNA alkylation repair protein [Bacteroidales bacterium]
MENFLQNLRNDLHSKKDETFQAISRRFFKEEIKCYGIRASVITKMSKALSPQIKERPKKEIFALCEGLWKSGYLEETFFAANWAYAIRKTFEPDDFKTFKRWIDNYIYNWASCDSFCNHTMGAFIEMYPSFLKDLKKLAVSENRWTRRAAAVSLIIPAKKGLFLEDIFEICNILLPDKDDMVQKGYGWLLKAASHKHPIDVFDYVMSKKETMPRTAFRYAIEKLPKDLRQKAMGK